MYTMKVRSISGTVHTFSYYDREVYERCLRVAEKSAGLTVLETDKNDPEPGALPSLDKYVLKGPKQASYSLEPAVETEITDGA